MDLMRCLSFFIIGLAFLSLTSALSGVSPGSYEVDFVNSIDQEFAFDFIFDEGVTNEIYVSGLLAEYISLDKTRILGSERVVARFKAGSEALESPGLNKILIGARQIVGENVVGVGIASNVWGIIKVEVPYPGKYVDLEVVAPNANAGEEVKLTLRAINRGNESIVLKLQIQIFKEDKKIDGLVFRTGKISPYETKEYTGLLNTSGYEPGEYIATGLGEYDGDAVARADDSFKLGEYYISVNNYSRIFEAGKISEFFIEVESFWNDVIEDVYVEVNIEGYTESSFITSTSNIRPWRTEEILGFLDTNGIKKDKIFGELILHYGGQVTKKEITLEIIQGRDYFFYLILFFIAVVVLGIVWRISIFVKRYKKLKIKR